MFLLTYREMAAGGVAFCFAGGYDIMTLSTFRVALFWVKG